MIVSFHPMLRGDRNFLCAGRPPTATEKAAMRRAVAVLLPQGCPEPLYRAARAACGHIFPDYDARFGYPGKIGQIELFRALRLPHPETRIFRAASEFRRLEPRWIPDRTRPLVFKCDWGGEGETVFLLRSPEEIAERIAWAARLETSGQKGFLLQEFIPCGGRSLRVVVIGDRLIGYWRTRPDDADFRASLAAGARIDHRSHPELRRLGLALAGRLCRLSGINLAGIDVIFDERRTPPAPLLLEINYRFGRAGIGGSERFYRLLAAAVRRWLRGIGATSTASRKKNDARRPASEKGSNLGRDGLEEIHAVVS